MQQRAWVHCGRRWTVAVAVALLAAGVSAGQAQQPVTPRPASPALKAGDVAPDFALPGASRYGRLASPVRLSDYRGETVVLAFFIRARTRG